MILCSHFDNYYQTCELCRIGAQKNDKYEDNNEKNISKPHYLPPYLTPVWMGMIYGHDFFIFLVTYFQRLTTVIYRMLKDMNLISNNCLNYCKKNLAVWGMVHMVTQVLSHVHALFNRIYFHLRFLSSKTT